METKVENYSDVKIQIDKNIVIFHYYSSYKEAYYYDSYDIDSHNTTWVSIEGDSY